MTKDYYKGFRRIKWSDDDKPAKWDWIQVISENRKFLLCERVNKKGEIINKNPKINAQNLIDKGLIVDSREVRENWKYGELEVIK